MNSKLILSFVLCTFSSTLVFAAPDSAQVETPVSSAVQPADTKPKKMHLADSTMTVTVKAPCNYVWDTLIDFDKYTQIFSRLESVAITKRDGNLVYVESHLKPHMFVKTETQHTVNDLTDAPNLLKWHLLDGNFRYVQGEWRLKPTSPTTTEMAYQLAVDPGPVIPAPLVSFVLHFVQKEIVNSFVQYTEKTYNASQKAANK